MVAIRRPTTTVAYASTEGEIMRLTTQRQVRSAFWQFVREFKPAGVSPRKIRNYSGSGRMHNTNTRVAFCDYIDMLSKSGDISPELADRVTLD